MARIGQLMKEGKLKDIIAVPTSIATKNQAEGASRHARPACARLASHACGPRLPRAALGIPLATLDTVPLLDVAIDGSDEVRCR